MKRIVAVLLCVILLTGCSYEAPGATVAQVTAAQTAADQAKAAAAQAQATATAVQTSDATKATQAYVDQKFAAIPASVNYEVRIAALEAKVTALETKVNGIPNNQQPQQTTTPMGSVSYTIQNPSQFGSYNLQSNYQLGLRIFNNKPDTRYVSFQIQLTSYQGIVAGTVSPATATVVSNSFGQNPITFTMTPIPAAPNTTRILFTPTGGGINNGQYQLNSGNQMDVTINLQATGTLSSLWNVAIIGSDVSSITGQ